MSDEQKPTQANAPQRFTRRGFLRAVALGTGGAFLAACGGATEPLQIVAPPYSTPTPASKLPLPGSQPTIAPGLPLEPFLALSAILTGVAGLSPDLGAVYLQSLQANPENDVEGLLAAAGFQGGAQPQSVEDLEAAGVFAQGPNQALADQITEMWYTGVYMGENGEPQAATLVDALAWKVLTFTKPITICGTPYFWESSPEDVR